MLRSPLPKWTGIVLIALAASMFVFTVSAAVTEYTIVKPYVVTISTAPQSLKIDELDFGSYYDPETNTYTSCKVTVRNYGGTEKSGTIYVYLFDSTGTEIAHGNASTGTVAAGITVLKEASLAWVSGNTVDDIASGRAVVAES